MTGPERNNSDVGKATKREQGIITVSPPLSRLCQLDARGALRQMYHHLHCKDFVVDFATPTKSFT